MNNKREKKEREWKKHKRDLNWERGRERWKEREAKKETWERPKEDKRIKR